MGALDNLAKTFPALDRPLALDAILFNYYFGDDFDCRESERGYECRNKVPTWGRQAGLS